jgi:hypothetical protein
MPTSHCRRESALEDEGNQPTELKMVLLLAVSHQCRHSSISRCGFRLQDLLSDIAVFGMWCFSGKMLKIN